MNACSKAVSLLAIAAIAVVGCHSEATSTRQANPAAPSTTATTAPIIGTKLGPDGHVSERKETFEQGELIFLTFDVPKETVGTQIEVIIRDAEGEEYKSLFLNPDAPGRVTAPIRGLEPGRYTAEGLQENEKQWEVGFELK